MQTAPMKSAALGGKLAGILVLGLSLALPVLADNGRRHGGEAMESMEGMEGLEGLEGMGQDQQDSEYPPTYFAHPEHANVLYAHIALMTLAWVVFLPVGMYSMLQTGLLPVFPGFKGLLLANQT